MRRAGRPRLPAGELPDPPLEQLIDLEHLGHPLDPLVDLGLIAFGQLEREREVAVDVQSCQ